MYKYGCHFASFCSFFRVDRHAATQHHRRWKHQNVEVLRRWVVELKKIKRWDPHVILLDSFSTCMHVVSNFFILRRRLISWCISRIDPHATLWHQMRMKTLRVYPFSFSLFCFSILSRRLISWCISRVDRHAATQHHRIWKLWRFILSLFLFSKYF